MIPPEQTFVGKTVECFTTDGKTWGTGNVFAYCDAPTVDVERADGTRFSWRHDLTRLAPVTETVEQQVAHAVALEHEKCAAWLESESLLSTKDGERMVRQRYPKSAELNFRRAAHMDEAAKAIRNGDHWKDGA